MPQKSKKKPEPVVHRTTFSNSGELTELDIPLSQLKKEAMSLSGPTSPTLLVLTQEAAVRITEQAITTALANLFESDLQNQNSLPHHPETIEIEEISGEKEEATPPTQEKQKVVAKPVKNAQKSTKAKSPRTTN